MAGYTRIYPDLIGLGWIFNRKTGEIRERQTEAGILNHGGTEAQGRNQQTEV